MSDTETPPITVNDSPLPDQLWAAVRQIAPPIMAFLVGRNLISNDLVVLLGVVGAVIWPIVAGQMKTRERAMQLRNVAAIVPDSVAKVV